MAGRTEFLESVRRRTYAGRYKPTRAPSVAWTPKSGPTKREEIEDRPARFLEELRAIGGCGRRASNPEEVCEYVLSLAREKGAKLLVRWAVEELDRLGVDEPLQQAGVEVVAWRDLENFREVAARADIGLSTAEWAVAETGSLVLTSGPGRGRSVTLLPSTYVAVIAVEKVLSTVPEAIEKYAGGGEAPANVCFHTGPSRSGDIEMTLVTGMHGPGDVHVILVG
jgi:L-lactate dehydrogenase complex protein LldG